MGNSKMKSATLAEISEKTRNAKLPELVVNTELLTAVMQDIKDSTLEVSSICKDTDLTNVILSAFGYDVTGQERKKQAPAVLNICGQRVMSEGDISAIIGAAKSRKTLLLTLIASGYINGSDIISTDRQGKIVYFDTEQSTYYAGISADRISTDKTKLSYYSLRNFTKMQRLVFVLYTIANERPALAIIDGITDLLTDFNSATESQAIVNVLTKYAETYRTHITSVLHTNPNSPDGKGRGHIGTELLNKAESTLKVLKDENTSQSEVNAYATRGAEFLPLIIGHTPEGKVYMQRKDAVIDIEEMKLYEATKEELNDQTENISTADLVKYMQVAIEKKHLKSKGDRSLKNTITNWHAKGWVVMKKGSANASYYTLIR